jgi:hypothetical protein
MVAQASEDVIIKEGHMLDCLKLSLIHVCIECDSYGVVILRDCSPDEFMSLL